MVVAVVGTGPAGLMAAHVLAAAGYRVCVFERRASAGRKLLIAGASGLNLAPDLPLDDLLPHYQAPSGCMDRIVRAFPPEEWLRFVEDLGIPTFRGTSRRHFVEGLKAVPLVHAWQAHLERHGVEFFFNRELVGLGTVAEGAGFGTGRVEVGTHGSAAVADGPERGAEWVEGGSQGCACHAEIPQGVEGGATGRATDAEIPQGGVGGVELAFGDGSRQRVAAAVLCLGGASWEKLGTVRWPEALRTAGVAVAELRASNVGFQVAWPPAFLAEAEGMPLKNVVLESSRGRRAGDLVVTRYGLEGTPVYFVGRVGTVHVDLKPDLTLAQVLRKLRAPRENLSPMRRAKRCLKLCPAALALLFHLAPRDRVGDVEGMAACVKRFPLELVAPQPLEEAISSAGGVCWSELDDHLMLRRHPGVFVAGEMVDWDAPTGGFLIQGCVSQGHAAAEGLVRWLESRADYPPPSACRRP